MFKAHIAIPVIWNSVLLCREQKTLCKYIGGSLPTEFWSFVLFVWCFQNIIAFECKGDVLKMLVFPFLNRC